MTIIGRLQLCGYNSRFNKSFSYVCSFEEGDDGPSLQLVDGPITGLTLQTDAVNRSVLLDLLYGAAVPVSAKLGLGNPTGTVTSARCEFPVKPAADVI